MVRISACHVEGPGSIPGRGEIFFLTFLNWKDFSETGCSSASLFQNELIELEMQECWNLE